MKPTIIKRSAVVGGHKTSISLENEFWNALKDIAKERNVTIAALLKVIDDERTHVNLSSAVRQFVLAHYKALART